jgi:hypothetical protein
MRKSLLRIKHEVKLLTCTLMYHVDGLRASDKNIVSLLPYLQTTRSSKSIKVVNKDSENMV